MIFTQVNLSTIKLVMGGELGLPIEKIALDHG